MSTLVGYIQQSSPRVIGEGNEALVKLNRRGEACLIDFYTQMIQEGRGYQVKLGTITAPLVGDVPLADTAAEAAVDAPAGLVVIPVEAQFDIESLGNTLPQCCVKAVGSISTSGTVFVPLPLFLNDNAPKLAARARARVQAAGAVTVTTEAATTTLQLFTKTLATAAADHALYKPTLPAFVANDSCVYLQVATVVTTGPSYFAHLNFIELLAIIVE